MSQEEKRAVKRWWALPSVVAVVAGWWMASRLPLS